MYSVTLRRVVHFSEIKAKSTHHFIVLTISQGRTTKWGSPVCSPDPSCSFSFDSFSLCLCSGAVQEHRKAVAQQDSTNTFDSLACLWRFKVCLLKYCCSFGHGTILYGIQFTMLKCLGTDELISTQM